MRSVFFFDRLSKLAAIDRNESLLHLDELVGALLERDADAAFRLDRNSRKASPQALEAFDLRHLDF
jgi:hypothetical protein